MINILFFVGAVCFVSWQLAIFFNDVWLRDAQQKQLRQKFEHWWLTVADLDKLKLALACTIKLNSLLDGVFGQKLFSGRAFWRTSVGATGLLIASLAVNGVLNRQTFAIRPWNNYHETAKDVENAIPQLEASFGQLTLSKAKLPIATITYLTTSNTPALTSTNAHAATPNNFAIPLKENGNLQMTNDSVAELVAKLEAIRQATIEHDNLKYSVIYSIIFFIILVLSNALQCYFSLVLSRLILREMIAAARPFSTLALLVTNFSLVFLIASVFLLFLTIIDVPLLWYFAPACYAVVTHSFAVFLFIFFGGQVASWIYSSPALKLVTMIAMLPCLFTLSVCVLSYAAMICRNTFHKCVSAVLLRCAEKGPLTVIVVTCSLLASLIAGLGKLLHWIN